MATKVGEAIKEARTAAGLTPEELAEKVNGVSAEDICQAEAGEKKLSQNKLKEIAKATGVTQKSLLDAAKEDAAACEAKEEAPCECEKKEEAPCECEKKEEAPAQAPAEMTDAELLELYKSADANTQKAAVSALKGDQQNQNAQNPLISALSGLFGGGDGPLNKLLNSEAGGEIVNSVVGMVGGFISKKLAEKQGGEQAEPQAEPQKEE